MDKNTMVCAAIAAAALVLALLIGLLAVWRKKRFKLIALTFDDGPSRYTETLLDGFKARHVVATFFMNGENGTGGVCGIKNGHEALLTRMWEEGHQLSNHTYRHADLAKLPAEQIAGEVAGVNDLIFKAAGGSFQCFIRTPYGCVNEAIRRSVKVPIILWNVDSLDWKYRDVDSVCNTVLSAARHGSIVLMHDLYDTSVEAALRVVDELKARGFEFVTVSELMRRTGVSLAEGVVYHGAKHRMAVHSAYQPPAAIVSKRQDAGIFEITCSVSAGLTIHYTTDGSYPKLSDSVYRGIVAVKEGTVFTAIGVDKWGTRTPPVRIRTGLGG